MLTGMGLLLYIALVIIVGKFLLSLIQSYGNNNGINWDSIINSAIEVFMFIASIVYLSGIMLVIVIYCQNQKSKFARRILPYILALILSIAIGWHFSFIREPINDGTPEEDALIVVGKDNTKGVKFFLISLIVCNAVVWYKTTEHKVVEGNT
ncbi:MAG: hypothetical protein U0T74_02525 [Chitinophagales bacterium]